MIERKIFCSGSWIKQDCSEIYWVFHFNSMAKQLSANWKSYSRHGSSYWSKVKKMLLIVPSLMSLMHVH